MHVRPRLALLVVVVLSVVAIAPLFADFPVNFDRRYFFGPVKNQLFRGSCATFASIAAMEYVPGVPKLSEAYAYSILKANDLEFDGSTLSRMKTFLEQNRMLAENRAAEKLPYESIASYGFNPDNAKEIDVARQFNRLKGTEAQLLRPYAIFHAINIEVRAKKDITLEWLKSTLNRLPIVAGLSINQALWEQATRGGEINDHRSGAIWRPSPLKVEPDNGGHAVLLLGFDPTGRVIFRNSWGVGWGELGYGYMKVDYLMAHIQEAMTIGGVIAEPRDRYGQQPEHFDVRVNAVPDNAGKYSLFISLVLHGNWVMGGGITGVEYTLYPPDDDVGSPLTRPLGKLTGTRADAGFYERFDDISYHGLKVTISITHSDGSVVTGYRVVPDTVTWNPLPPTH